MKEELQKRLEEIVKKLTKEKVEIQLTIPNDISKGDYASNIAFHLAKLLGRKPLEVAEEIVKEFGNYAGIEYIEPAVPGFINFYLSKETLSNVLTSVLSAPEKVATSTKMQNKKIMVEFAHPNTHKEMHIGHMRTLITGEAVSRLLTSQGAEVFRANYQGDIGPHVAKALYGIEQIMKEKELSLDTVEEWSSTEKAHFLGEGYARGSKDYETAKEQIDEINTKLYKKEQGHYWDLYQTTRQWSLDYYDEFYTRFYTKFDRLFMESQMHESGKKIVEEHVGTVFKRDPDGSIIFPGEKYGLHTRVFVTQAGNPTYEGKEMGNAYAEWEAFHFDKKIHVVANEQTGYFQVVFKALELIDPKKFKDKQYHLSMGMVQLVGKKMSSRTGEVLTVDWLIDQVKGVAGDLFKEGKVVGQDRDEALEEVTIGAVKYSVLKGGAGQNVVFDIEKSVSLNGNSGPYVQYAYTRTQSVLEKAESSNTQPQLSKDYTPQNEELEVVRKIVHFPEIVENAAKLYSPNIVCEYLFELAQLFNNFYQKYRILNAGSAEEKEYRLALTKATGVILKQGLNLLGIEAPQKM